MKTKRQFRNAAAVLALVALSITSCSKDDAKENEIVADATTLSEADVKTIVTTDDFSASFDTVISDIIFNNGASGKSNSTTCFTTETTDTGYAISFDNCSLDGRSEMMSGTIEMENTSTSDMIRFVVTWTNFAIDDYELNGTRTYILKNFISPSQYSFQIYSLMRVKNADAIEITEEGEKLVEFMFDSTTETISANVTGRWSISGGTGINHDVSVNIPLEINNNCEYITQGTMQVSNVNGIYDVDFGDGTCDDKAIITKAGGTPINISLKD